MKLKLRLASDIRHAASSAAAFMVASAIFAMGLAPALLAADQPAGAQRESQLNVTVKEGDAEREATIRFLIYLPEGYGAEASKAKKWPLLLFLHGSGERGDDLNLVKKHGPPKLAASQPFPFVVVSPQCPQESRWNSAELAKLVELLANTHRIDQQRMYVTGLSMGGSGTWSLLAEYPGLFAAGIPICGKGDPASAERIAKTPVWAFLGAKDKAELVTANEELVAAVKKAGGNIQFTVYPEAGHDSWTATYNNPQVYKWLLDQRSVPKH